MTSKEILLNWIETALARNGGEVRFRSSDIQTRVPRMGKQLYGEVYSPNNYLRRFRELKGEDMHKATSRGIADIQEVPSHSRESLWKATAQPSAPLTDHRREPHGAGANSS